MNIPKEFVDMVDADIKRIDDALNQLPIKGVDLFLELDGKYQYCVNEWTKSMMGTDSQQTKINHVAVKSHPYMVEINLKLAKAKLEAFKYGVNAISLPPAAKTEINIQNNNNIQVNITFDDVRSQVEEMTSLSDEETQELLDRINELEEIVNSKDKKKTKWQKVSPILKWLADKSFDAAMTVLPLILKLQEQ